MSHHYSDSPTFEATRKLSTARSYNDKAREALPGLGGGALDTYKNGKCGFRPWAIGQNCFVSWHSWGDRLVCGLFERHIGIHCYQKKLPSRKLAKYRENG